MKSLIASLVVLGTTTLVSAEPTYTSVSALVVTGTDHTDANHLLFDPRDIVNLTTSDDLRKTSNGNWPMTGAYDESQYLEFVFSADLPSDAAIQEVVLVQEYRRSAVLNGVKLKVWNGTSFLDYPLTPPPTGGDTVVITDLLSSLHTSEQVNQARIRFLAYRNTPVASATTSHDLVNLKIGYYLVPEPSTLLLFALIAPALLRRRANPRF